MATANNKRIEESAVIVVKAALLRCPILDAYISENDKTPSWDGTVFAYKNGHQRKRDWLGRVPVQVKGTEKEFTSDYATFSCSLIDLRNYYQDGGCIFFLVSLNVKTGEHRIFYASLLVYDLKKIIDKAGTQKSTTIKLRPFPEHDSDEMGIIFLSFIQDYSKQRGFVGKSISSIEELKSTGMTIDSLSFQATSLKADPFNIGKFFSTHDFYLYAKPQGVDIEIPVDKVHNAIISMPISKPVSIDGIVHYEKYLVVHENGIPSIQLGKGVRINLATQGKKSSIHFTPKGKLSDLIRDASFMVGLISQKKFYLGDIEMPLLDLTDVDVEKYKRSLSYYKDVQKMLDILGTSEELKCDGFTEQDELKLKNLVLAILYNKKLSFSNEENAIFYGPISFANLSIWVWGIRQENGEYKIENFFSPHSIAAFKWDDYNREHPFKVSHFMLLDKTAFLRASNINYQYIEDDLLSTTLTPWMMDKATLLLLEMLKAYDEQKKKKPELLALAEKTCAWIRDSGAEYNTQITTLNKLQIIKRQRDLTAMEIIELGRIIDSTQSPELLCGAYLLLGEIHTAQEYFDKLGPQDQEEFLTYPICHFGKLTIRQKDSKE